MNLYQKLSESATSNEKISHIGKLMETLSECPEADVGPMIGTTFEALLRIGTDHTLKKTLLRSLKVISVKHPTTYFETAEEVVRLHCGTSEPDDEIFLTLLAVAAEEKGLIFAHYLEETRTHEPPQQDQEKESVSHEGTVTDHDVIFLLLFESSLTRIKWMWESANRPETPSDKANIYFQTMQQMLKYVGILINDKRGFLRRKPLNSVDSTIQLELLTIASSDRTPLDLRNSCSWLFIVIEMNDGKDSVRIFHDICGKRNRFKDITELGMISLFHGILCHMERRSLFTPWLEEGKYSNVDVGSELLHHLHLTLNTITHSTSLAVMVSRILSQFMIKLSEHVLGLKEELPKDMVQRFGLSSTNANIILTLIWTLWDHFVENVKHTARDTFNSFIKVQNCLNKNEALKYFTKLASSLSLTLCRRQNFRALACLVPFIDVNAFLESTQNMIQRLIKMLRDPAYAPYAADLLEALFTKHQLELNSSDWNEFWFQVFFSNFSREMIPYGYERLLEKLLRLSSCPTHGITMLSSKHLSETDLCLLIMCTKICMKTLRRDLKYAKTDTVYVGEKEKTRLWKGIIPFSVLTTALESQDEALCILAFNLLCESSKSTELYEDRELIVVKSFITKGVNNPSPSFRQKFLSNIKKALSRIDKGLAAKSKRFASSPDKSELNNTIDIHTAFVRELFLSLSRNICVGGNFLRRSSSLQILELVFELVQNGTLFSPLKETLFTLSLRDSLILCLADSYETNKKITLRLLDRMSECCNFPKNEMTLALMESVWTLARSTKPPDSITASYLLSVLLKHSSVLFPDDFFPPHIRENKRLLSCSVILTRLRKDVEVARCSLLTAATSGPMYGLVLCLREVLSCVQKDDLVDKQQWWSALVNEAVALCIVISNLVASVVASSSPEGHLPMDLSKRNRDLMQNSQLRKGESAKSITVSPDVETEQTVSAQLLLLCGWRSIKEISLLFGCLIRHPFLLLLSLQDVEIIGNFFMIQLTETRHRGAFEQAYNGFVMICDQFWRCSDNQMNRLPKMWLQSTIDTIQDVKESRLCATRRSAGVPFIVQAIVSTEPTFRGGGECLKSTIESLLQLASGSAETDGRIHAMNILRALFRDAKISEEVIPYVSRGVKLAFEGADDNSWSLRNSASLMFASLVNRMFGVKKTKEDLHTKNAVSAFSFFKRYPDLHNHFLETLEKSVKRLKNGDVVPSCFPLLMILARQSLVSSDGYSTSIALTSFIPLILEFTASPVLQLRCLASRALIPLLTPPALPSLVDNLCLLLSLKNQNHLHGILLCLTQIFKSFSDYFRKSKETPNQISESLSSISWVAKDDNPCLFTRACAIHLFTYIGKENIISANVLKPLAHNCFLFLLKSSHQQCYSHIPGADMFTEVSLKLFFFVYQREINENSQFLQNLVDFPSIEVQTAVLAQVLNVEDQPFTDKDALDGCRPQFQNPITDKGVLDGCRPQFQNPITDKDVLDGCRPQFQNPITNKDALDGCRPKFQNPFTDKDAPDGCHPQFQDEDALDGCLPQFQNPITDKVLDLINKTKEQHPQRDKLVYQLLIKMIRRFPEENVDKQWLQSVSEVFDSIVYKLGSEVREELVVVMIDCSFAILLQRLKIRDHLDESIVVKWVEVLVPFCSTDFPLDVRHAATQAVSEGLVSLHHYDKLSDKVELILLRLIIKLHLDDECLLQSTAAKQGMTFLYNQSMELEPHERTTLFSPSFSLESLFTYLISKKSEALFTLLLFFALTEEANEAEDESQDDGKAFDKGKIYVYREDVYVTRMIAQVIDKWMTQNDVQHLNELHVDLEVLQDDLLTVGATPGTTPSELEESKGESVYSSSGYCDSRLKEQCSLLDFVEILRNEMEFILRRLKTLQKISPFQVKNFDLWIERLARRALLWSSLSKIGRNTPLDDELVNTLKLSLVKPTIFDEILLKFQEGGGSG